VIDFNMGELAHLLNAGSQNPCPEADPHMQNQGFCCFQSSVFLRRDLRHQADWAPNPSFNRTCFGVAAPGIISFLPGFTTLAHAG
jgi:hypothetical protein